MKIKEIEKSVHDKYDNDVATGGGRYGNCVPNMIMILQQEGGRYGSTME
jgi:hypothetical protein